MRILYTYTYIRTLASIAAISQGLDDSPCGVKKQVQFTSSREEEETGLGALHTMHTHIYICTQRTYVYVNT